MNKITKTMIATVCAVTFGTTVALAATPDWFVQDSKLTPGLTNSAVTQANIKTTVCKTGWTTTIRPTVTYTNKLKLAQLKGTYAYLTKTWGTSPSAYEEDHLISLQLGGDPSSEKNLWPEPYAGIGARKKDVAETALKRLVCAGTMKLVDAQKAILDWPSAYKKYVVKTDVADNSDG